jgi:hypothetical protein
MSLWAEMDERARRLGILDTKLVQAATIFLTLAIVKVIPEIMAVNIWWFLGLAVLCVIKPIHTFYFAGKAPGS